MEGHCAPKSLLSPAVAGTRHTTAKSHRVRHTNTLKHNKSGRNRSGAPFLKTVCKKPGLLGASVQLELQRLQAGRTMSCLPLVPGCSLIRFVQSQTNVRFALRRYALVSLRCASAWSPLLSQFHPLSASFHGSAFERIDRSTTPS